MSQEQQPRDWSLAAVVARVDAEFAGTSASNGGRMGFAGLTMREWAIIRHHLPLAPAEGAPSDA
jgi:hypothetical protein